jgi:hypothetical protein
MIHTVYISVDGERQMNGTYRTEPAGNPLISFIVGYLKEGDPTCFHDINSVKELKIEITTKQNPLR